MITDRRPSPRRHSLSGAVAGAAWLVLASSAAQASSAGSVTDATPETGGPFKVTLPVQSPSGAASSAAAAAATAPTASSPTMPAARQPASAIGTGIKPPRPVTNVGPVRTLSDSDPAAATPRPAAGAQPTRASQPAAVAAPPPPAASQASASPLVEAAGRVERISVGGQTGSEQMCMAGCYEPTASTSTRPPVGATRSAAAPSSAAQVVECIAGCDGVGGRAAQPAAATAEPETAGSSGGGNNRITVLRGVTRSKVYGVGQ
jgi:hypothetical protein